MSHRGVIVSLILSCCRFRDLCNRNQAPIPINKLPPTDATEAPAISDAWEVEVGLKAIEGDGRDCEDTGANTPGLEVVLVTVEVGILELCVVWLGSGKSLVTVEVLVTAEVGILELCGVWPGSDKLLSSILYIGIKFSWQQRLLSSELLNAREYHVVIHD